MPACKKNSVKQIKADDFSITYGNSIYDPVDRDNRKAVDLLVGRYNDMKFEGETSQEINYGKAVTIIFVYKDKISGHVTIDDAGICEYGNDSKHFLMDKRSKFYKEAVGIFNDIKEKYDDTKK